MSYTTNKNLLSSTGIAVLASLGIHGLLWAVLPGLTVDSQANKSRSERTVGLVDLSPQEQNRLPQIPNPAENTLPSFATQLNELPPLPPLPPYQTSVIPPLQLPPGSEPIYNTIPNQNSAPPQQTFQVPLSPTNTYFPPIVAENLPNSPNNYPIPAAPQVQPFVLPANNGLPNPPLTPDRTLPPDDYIATDTPSPQPGLQPTQANPNPPENPSVEANKLPEKGKQELLAMRESMKNNFPPGAATPAPTNTRALSRQEIATALRRQSSSNQPTPPTRALSRQEIVTALRGNRNLSNELSEETKTALDNLEKFTRQQARVQAQNPDVVTKPPIRRKLTTCDRAIDGDVAIIGVVVNPQGKRLSEPNLITKTGKADITQAQNYVRNYAFAKTGETNSYNFRFEFDYIARKCAQANPTPSPTPNISTPAPTLSIPDPKSTPTPDSTPEPNPPPEPTATPFQPTPPPIDPQKPSF